ncbi:MAG: hypothetical protein HQ530_00505 [Parcubacteria group bacterium]|nr:hypothetical protein [Parcubacteria group bacterium]
MKLGIKGKIFLLMAAVFLLAGFFVFSGSAVKAEENQAETVTEEAATNDVTIYFFWQEGCPHCEKENEFLDKFGPEHPEVEIKRYELRGSADNRQLLSKLSSELGLKTSSVPVTLINSMVVYGYMDDEVTGKQIEQAVSMCQTQGCDDLVKDIIGGDGKEDVAKVEVSTDIENKQTIPEKIDLPVFGEIDTKSISIPALTIIIAAIDGFNPCAMWVLLFLISLLLGMKNRRRMWALGIAFIVTSAASYFLFLAAWLNVFQFLSFVTWIRVVIGLIAVGSGLYHLRDYWKNRDRGCVAAGGEKRKKVFDKLRRFSSSEKFWVALGGIVLVAFSINLVELVCSAGLPAIYTNILSSSELPTWQYYSYLLLYIFIFMLDDLVVFFIAMITLKAVGISKKYSRFSSLIGGIVILILGVLLLLRPDLLMFG